MSQSKYWAGFEMTFCDKKSQTFIILIYSEWQTLWTFKIFWFQREWSRPMCNPEQRQRYEDNSRVCWWCDPRGKIFGWSIADKGRPAWMKDMGQLHYCLGINFEVNEQGISLCQKQYLRKLLEKYGLYCCHPNGSQCQANKGWWLQQESRSNSISINGRQSVHAAKATIAYAVGLSS